MARTTTEHRILIQSSDKDGRVQLENLASGNFRCLPGMLLKNNSGTMIAHPTAGSFLPAKLVALECPWPDTDASATSAAIDIYYKAGDTLRYIQARPGDVCNMLLGTASGSAAATEGISQMVSDGLGGVIVASGTALQDNEIVGVPDESVDNSGETTYARLKVRII